MFRPVLNHPQAIYSNRDIAVSLFESLCIELIEDGLSTGRNM
jgi:hypothetical protein